MGTRTEMIYDMDGFRAWKRPVFFHKIGETAFLTSSSTSFLPISSLRIFPLGNAFYLTEFISY
ncbi:hypothetical protein LguiA_035944 [Lonicera macranthoides]